MELFLLALQVCGLVIATANGYVLFAANLEDFRNLAKKFVPEELAGKLTEIVSESSLQYNQRNDKEDDANSDDDRKLQRGRSKINSKYESKGNQERSGVDQIGYEVRKNIKSTTAKNKRLYADSNYEEMRENINEKKNDGNNMHDNLKEQEPEYDHIDISTTFTSKDKRYRTVQRMSSSKQWYDKAPSYSYTFSKDVKDDHFHETTPQSNSNEDAWQAKQQKSIEISNEREKTSTRFTPTIEREMKEVFKKKITERGPVEMGEFEYVNPTSTSKKRLIKQIINGRNEKHIKLKKKKLKGNDDLIFDTILLNKKKGYEDWPEKDEDYFSKEAIKVTTNKLNKKIGRENPNRDDVFEKEETTTRVGKPIFLRKKPQIIKVETDPSVTEKDVEDNEEPKVEEVKAKTENLLFDSKEENVADNVRIKSTGIPTRERYKMSSPDYYHKLPTVVEKYNFNEPLPDKDREREKIDDRFAQEPARVNMKAKQQIEASSKPNISKQFKSILEELVRLVP